MQIVSVLSNFGATNDVFSSFYRQIDSRLQMLSVETKKHLISKENHLKKGLIIWLNGNQNELHFDTRKNYKCLNEKTDEAKIKLIPITSQLENKAANTVELIMFFNLQLSA